jgi:hypothetical protein
MIPSRISISRGGRLVRITLSDAQAAGLREMARHSILGGTAAEVAKFLLMEALIKHAWAAYPHIKGAQETRGEARGRNLEERAMKQTTQIADGETR